MLMCAMERSLMETMDTCLPSDIHILLVVGALVLNLHIDNNAPLIQEYAEFLI